LLAGKLIYVCCRNGRTAVFEALPDAYSEEARNTLPDEINASPIAVGGKLFIRTAAHLYCIGENDP
jgi:hypothetical protein